MKQSELLIRRCFDEHQELVNSTYLKNYHQILIASELVFSCFESGNKLIIFGNGGSASDAQHISAEFVGRFLVERSALPAISLATDTSALTAISNDYGYENVFKRQVEALAKPGDLLMAISTSGNSANVINGLRAGKVLGCKTIGLTGGDGGKMNDLSDINIIIPSTITARIQEMHILIGHIFCNIVDSRF